MALDTVAMLPLLLVARESGRKPTRTADDDDDDDAWACSSLPSTVYDIRLTYHASLLYCYLHVLYLTAHWYCCCDATILLSMERSLVDDCRVQVASRRYFVVAD